MKTLKNISGKMIREARINKNPKLTQKELSEKLQLVGINLSPSSVNKIELGTRPVTDIQLIGFAKALMVEPSWLLSYGLANSITAKQE